MFVHRVVGRVQGPRPVLCLYGFLRSVGLGPAEVVLLEHGVSPARFVFVFVGRARARSFCLLQLQRGFLEHLRLLIIWSKKKGSSPADGLAVPGARAFLRGAHRLYI